MFMYDFQISKTLLTLNRIYSGYTHIRISKRNEKKGMKEKTQTNASLNS